MACCTVSNCGDNVTINTCCDDATGTDLGGTGEGTGSGKSTLGSFSATSKCINGDLIITIDGFNACGSYSVEYLGIIGNDTDCSYTINGYDYASAITITTDTSQGTDTLTLTPVACSQPNYQLSAQCGTEQDTVELSWTNPNGETLYLYRTETDGSFTLLYGGTDTVYTDAITWGDTTEYLIAKSNSNPYPLASTSFDTSVCSPCDCATQVALNNDTVSKLASEWTSSTTLLSTLSTNISETTCYHHLSYDLLYHSRTVEPSKYNVSIVGQPYWQNGQWFVPIQLTFNVDTGVDKYYFGSKTHVCE